MEKDVDGSGHDRRLLGGAEGNHEKQNFLIPHLHLRVYTLVPLIQLRKFEFCAIAFKFSMNNILSEVLSLCPLYSRHPKIVGLISLAM
jgi:hypothetical protein